MELRDEDPPNMACDKSCGFEESPLFFAVLMLLLLSEAALGASSELDFDFLTFFFFLSLSGFSS